MFKDCVFWLGAVENIEDPEKRGRVQVRVFGAHDVYNPHVTDYQGRTEWASRYGKSSSSSSGSEISPSTGTGNGGGSETSHGSGNTSSSNKIRAYHPNGYLQKSQRNNNPLNLYGGDRRYNDLAEGTAAGLSQLLAYQSSWKKRSNGYGLESGVDSTTGTATLRDIWRTIAPNDGGNKHTEANIEKKAKKLGIDPDKPLNLNDTNTLYDVFCEIVSTENSFQLTREDCAAAMAGQYTENMTSQSTYLAPDGTLVVGASNATLSNADKSKIGQKNAPNSSTKWRIATEEEYNESQANIKSGNLSTYTPDRTPNGPKSGKSKAPTTPSTDKESAGKGGSTPAGAAGKTAQEETVTPTTRTIESVAGTPDSTCHKLPTGDLPWALCLYPCSEYGGTSFATLPAPQVQVGAWVFGVSLDGPFMNQLIVLGIMPTAINIDALSTNPSEASTKPLTNVTLPNTTPLNPVTSGSGSSSGSGSGSSSEVNGMEFNQLLDGVWNAESSRSANKKRSSSYAYGAMQLMPALAATYVLAGAASSEFTATGLTLSEDMKKSLESIKNAYGTDIEPYLSSDENVVKFCDALLDNDTLNKAIGAAYLHDCLVAKRGNGDPVLACLYYMEGEYNTHEIMGALGYANNEIPANVTYSTFISQVNDIIKEAGQKNDFEVYVNNILNDYGGVSQAESNRPGSSDSSEASAAGA